MTARYAVYFAPPTGSDLMSAAESWLGRSADPAAPAPVPAVPAGWTRAGVDEITRNARRYGFHATIRAPFRLAAERTREQLAERLAEFTAGREPVVVPALELSCVGSGFFALTAGPGPDLIRGVAADVVREMNDLRDLLTADEIARRRPDTLDARERGLLSAYGYPYVLDRFHFHLTLTDPVPVARREAVDAALRTHFAGLLGRDLLVGGLSLFAEPAPGRPFVLDSTYPFLKGDQ